MAWADQSMAWAARAEECTSYLEGILSAMVTRLSMHFGADFVSLGDMLADVPTPAPLALVLASTPAPPTRAPSSGDDDDEDLGDF
ncbi:hypothetical protein COCNU_scaffold003116G000080 [Cocos nucifera]|nr:hypothetical protein [Cocos nucifera]